jgi:hypothetical protein
MALLSVTSKLTLVLFSLSVTTRPLVCPGSAEARGADQGRSLPHFVCAAAPPSGERSSPCDIAAADSYSDEIGAYEVAKCSPGFDLQEKRQNGPKMGLSVN